MKDVIMNAVNDAQNQKVTRRKVHELTTSQQPIFENEFLFFIKPELLLEENNKNLSSILDMILSKIENNYLSIRTVTIYSAEYLEKNDIIARHYGVINEIATKGSSVVSSNAKDVFLNIFKESIDDTNALGGLQFLNKYNDFNSFSLDILTQNTAINKLAGGTYCTKLKMDSDEIYLLNGFHPRQLEHFIEKGRCIVCMELEGDINWSKARGGLIGETEPSKASNDSIRRELFENKEIYGLKEVSRGSNGVHLSAGPIEALVELIRYGSNFENNQIKQISDYSTGKKLQNRFTHEQVEFIMSNGNLDVDGKEVSVFDLTEEINTNEAINLIAKYIK